MLTVACLLAIGTYACVLFPLWRRTPRRSLCLLSLLLGCTACLYCMIGTPSALLHPPISPPQTLEEAIVRLQHHIATHPDDVYAWLLLSQAYFHLGQIPKALHACDQGLLHAPPQAESLVACAQLRLMASSHDPYVFTLLHRALAIAPGHARARLLEGLAQRQAGQAALAAQTWQALRAQTQADARAELDRLIAQARQEAGMAPIATPQPPH